MKAEIEPIVGIIRVWLPGKVYGDPYEWCATVRYLKKDTIEILGYTKKVSKECWKAIIKECQYKQITKILAVSYPNGKRKEKWITVPSPFEELE